MNTMESLGIFVFFLNDCKLCLKIREMNQKEDMRIYTRASVYRMNKNKKM